MTTETDVVSGLGSDTTCGSARGDVEAAKRPGGPPSFMTEGPPLHSLVNDRCRGDGICTDICPKDVLELYEGKPRTVAGAAIHCLRCGQCVAVCPNGSLALQGFGVEALEPASTWRPSHDAFLGFMRSRRSIRTFADRPVDRSLIARVLDATAAAPPAFPPHATEVLVLDHPEDLKALRKALVQGYDKVLSAASSPIGRMVMRFKRSVETYHILKTHVLQIVRWDNARFRAQGIDPYTYGAPVVMLFHADRWTAGHQESAMVAATYATLSAHALGLGATMLSIVPPILNNLAHDLRRSLGIPKDNTVVIAVILGHPKYTFRQAIKRPLKGARFLRPGQEPAPSDTTPKAP